MIQQTNYSLADWADFLKRRFNPYSEGSLPEPKFVTPEQDILLWTDIRALRPSTQNSLAAGFYNDNDHVLCHYVMFSPLSLWVLNGKWSQETRVMRDVVTKDGPAEIHGELFRLVESSIVINGYSKDGENWVWEVYVCETSDEGYFAKLVEEPKWLEAENAENPPEPYVIAPPEPDRVKIHA